MARHAKAVLLGAIISVLGLMACLSSPGMELEEGLGLGILFKLRGPRRPPNEIMIVSLEKVPDDPLDLPRNPDSWPRSVHGLLVDELARRGAAVIAFDLTFDKPRPAEQDIPFAQAIERAGNVVLCAHLEKEVITWPDRNESEPTDVHVERLIPPIPCLAEAAVAYAPFPLPKVPVRLSQYWTYKSSAGEYPSLPVVAFQLYALDAYDLLYQSLARRDRQVAGDLPSDSKNLLERNKTVWLLKRMRSLFQDNPSLTRDTVQDLRTMPAQVEAERGIRLAERLVAMYNAQEGRHLNFYGPPGTIPTVPYHRIIAGISDRDQGPYYDLRGKTVFVGLSERLRSEQKDDFYTVFSRADGIDLSGVEIAATAWANLLEDMPVRPLSWGTLLGLIFFWGILLGLLNRYLGSFSSFLVTSILAAVYLLVAQHGFSQDGRWYPLVVPLFIEAPTALLGGLLWHFVETHQDRRRIRQAFGHYLPPAVVEQIAADVAAIPSSSKVVYGTCLFTDAGRYTTLSETMGPQQLHQFMNSYYEIVFRPVRTHNGLISDVIGDAMLAIWAAAEHDRDLRFKACCAALDIVRASRDFFRGNAACGVQMPTRIGIHSGPISLGNIGALNHFEYRPIGDVVNTASRIEGLNKYLGTQLLVSEETLHALDEFLARDLGEFLLAGKTKPVRVHELICVTKAADENELELCSHFSTGLGFYRKRGWQEAITAFNQALTIRKEDGPSYFYIKLCVLYEKNPPGIDWNGVVALDKK